MTQTVRDRVTRMLFAFVADQRDELDVEVHPLLDELEALVAAGGKRLRPVFCYWGHIGAGGTAADRIVRVGAGLEMLHTFALIHDDVMDLSPVRRGRLASFRALRELAAGIPHRGDPDRFGASAAVLAGDLALVLADRLLATSGFAAEPLGRAFARYDRMRTRAIAGQYLDLLAAYRGDADEDTARRIGTLKSAGYTVADPLAIGALLATDDTRVVEVLEAYGRPVGEAFQLRDDVLGVFGNPSITGKDRDGDLREGKQTVLVAKAKARASDDDRAFLDERLGDPKLLPDEADRARTIFRSTGALDDTLALIADLTAEAKSALQGDVLEADAAGVLRELADEVSVRDL